MRARAEEFDLEVVASAPLGPRESGLGTPGASRTLPGPLPWVAVAVVLVLAGVALAERPPPPWRTGIVEHIAAPAEQWFTPLQVDISDPHDVWLGPEAAILANRSRVHAFAVADGTELWRAEGRYLRCHQGEPDGDVLCVSGEAAQAELIRIDAMAGETMREHRPGILAAVDVDGGVLSLRQEGERTFLGREDSSGTQRWSADLGFAGAWYVPALLTLLGTTGDYVMVGMGLGGPSVPSFAVRDAADGQVAEEIGDLWVGRPPSDAANPWLLVAEDGSEFRYLNAEGELSEARSQWGHYLVVDEDLMSDVSLHLAHGELQALSHRRPDHVYWSRSTSGMTAVLARVGGLVLVQEGPRTSALDERTGAQIWSERLPLVAWRSLSDGSTLLSLDSASGRQVLSGVDVRSGELLFEVTGVEGPEALVRTERTYAGRLLVVTTAGLSMWSLA
ncbi:PQQ-binding-like beta-propeller repeat protein [Pseudactinotalea sp. Z1748]|uniref:outer membrane protein assembly factor BamB family protein n=1 Tax=Pseudactinotalea sp. Z1748 TaxID=3413027 RepID=UPI003C79E6C1